jgi:hypothetical protein
VIRNPYSSSFSSAKVWPWVPVFTATVLPSRSSSDSMSLASRTPSWMPLVKYGSLKSKVCLRSSVIDMPAMTASTWFDCSACRAASNPS